MAPCSSCQGDGCERCEHRGVVRLDGQRWHDDGRLVAYGLDHAEAEVIARQHTPSSVRPDIYGTFEVRELGVRGSDGVTRDRRYPSLWGYEALLDD